MTAVQTEVQSHDVGEMYVAPVACAPAWSVCSWSVSTACLAGVVHACTSVAWAARHCGPTCVRYGMSPSTTFLVPGDVIEPRELSSPSCHCPSVGGCPLGTRPTPCHQLVSTPTEGSSALMRLVVYWCHVSHAGYGPSVGQYQKLRLTAGHTAYMSTTSFQ